MADEVSKDQQIFTTDQGIKRAILEKTRKAFEEKGLAKIKKRVSAVIREIKDLQEKGKPSYVFSYKEISRSDESGIEEGEGWNLFDWSLNPYADLSEFSQSEREFQFALAENLGFSMEDEPPYSIEKENLSIVRGEVRGRKVYYTESPLYPGVYLARIYEKTGNRKTWRQNYPYASSEQDLKPMVGLPQAPARA